MQWLITKQIQVDAETPEEAVQKINEGKTIAFNVQQRPLPQPMQRPLPAGMNVGATGSPVK